MEPPQGLPEAGKVREVLAKEAGTSANKIRQALAVQKLAVQERVTPELAEQLKNGAVKLHDVIKRAAPPPAPAPVPEPPPAPAKDAATRTERQQMIDGAAKRRMVDALSQFRGACRGLSELNAIAVRRACTAEEIATWAAIARGAAKELCLFVRNSSPQGKSNESEIKDRPGGSAHAAVHPFAQREIVPLKAEEAGGRARPGCHRRAPRVEYEINGQAATWIIDGQHRWRALMDHGMGEWLVEVKIHLEATDDARASALFLKLNAGPWFLRSRSLRTKSRPNCQRRPE